MSPEQPQTGVRAIDEPLPARLARGAAVVVVCGGLLALSLRLGGWVASGRRHDPVLSQDQGLGKSCTVRLNAVSAETRACRSPLTPEQVVNRYAGAARRTGSAGHHGRPFIQRLPDGRWFARYREGSGQQVTVIAGPAPGGGCAYTVSRGEPGNPLLREGGDSAGTDPADVPRPPDSSRVFCIENPAGSGQSMLLYHGYNAPEATRRFYLRRMPELGWRLDEKMAQHLGDARLHTDLKLSAHYLAFKKGRRTCIISSARRPSGTIATTVLVR